jgi:hypothetical protein
MGLMIDLTGARARAFRSKTPARRSLSGMAGVLAIQVYEPGERADELLACIAAKLRLERLPDPISEGPIHVLVDDHPASVEAAEDALDEAGDDGRLIVRVLTPG